MYARISHVLHKTNLYRRSGVRVNRIGERPQHSAHTHTISQTLFELTHSYTDRHAHTHTYTVELTGRRGPLAHSNSHSLTGPHGHTRSGRRRTGRRGGRFKYRTRVWSEYRVRVWRAAAETWSRSGDSVSVLRRLCVRLQVVRVPPPCVADDDDDDAQ